MLHLWATHDGPAWWCLVDAAKAALSLFFFTCSQSRYILAMGRRHVRTHSSRGSRGGTSLRVFPLFLPVLQIAGLRLSELLGS